MEEIEFVVIEYKNTKHVSVYSKDLLQSILSKYGESITIDQLIDMYRTMYPEEIITKMRGIPYDND